MTFGDKILKHRKERDWSQHELADKLGTTQAMVGKYERNEITPSVEVAKNIADILEISLDYLVDEKDEIVNLKNKETLKRAVEIEKLPDDIKDHVYYLIDAAIRDNKTKMAYTA